VFNDTSVEVLTQQGIYCEVRVPSKDLVGYVKKQHLDFVAAPPNPSPPNPAPVNPSPPNPAPVLKPSARKLPVATAARRDGTADFIILRLKPDVKSDFIGPRIPNGSKLEIAGNEGDFTRVRLSQENGQAIEGFVKTQYLEIELSSEEARKKFDRINASGSLDERWKCLKAYIEAKQREVADYHLQNLVPMEKLMSMKALEAVKERAFE
jgi:hypothetical protein